MRPLTRPTPKKWGPGACSRKVPILYPGSDGVSLWWSGSEITEHGHVLTLGRDYDAIIRFYIYIVAKNTVIVDYGCN